MTNRHYEFDIALSFAGEQRHLAEELAAMLRASDVRTFYDHHEEAQLWGKDLYQHLQSVYRDRAKYCLIFISKDYARKVWPRHELRQAQARALQENREYILPVRVDDTPLPGMNATTGFLDLRQRTVESLYYLVLEKVFGREKAGAKANPKFGKMIDFRGTTVVAEWPSVLAKAQRKTTYLLARETERIRYGAEGETFDASGPCHDCAAQRGEFHVPGCDVERCPLCDGQAAFCGCVLDDLDELLT